MLTLDVPYIFDAVGGPAALLDMLRRNEPGMTLRYPTVQMWRQRGAVSAAWVVPILYAMVTQRGHTLGECLTDTDPFGGSYTEADATMIGA